MAAQTIINIDSIIAELRDEITRLKGKHTILKSYANRTSIENANIPKRALVYEEDTNKLVFKQDDGTLWDVVLTN